MAEHRKTIFEIINGKHPLKEEIEKIRILFQEVKSIIKVDFYGDLLQSWSIEEFASAYILEWKGRGTCISLNDVKKALGIDSNLFVKPSEDKVISYLEYVLNICLFVENMVNKYHVSLDATRYDAVLKNIGSLLSELNYRPCHKDEGLLTLVPNSIEVKAVVELIDDKQLKIAILEYNHRGNKGKIDKKRSILNMMAQYIEPKRQMLKSMDSKLDGTIFNIFNNFNIRHNNIDPSNTKNFNPKCKVLSENEKTLEAFYDDAYYLVLLAIIELENLERKERVTAILEMAK